MFTIDKNVELTPKNSTSILDKLPLNEMEIGDSVLVPFELVKHPSNILEFLRKRGVKPSFTTVKEENGTRIFKIK